jgi:diguanylate cyclase (GGDEF)-like protein
MQAYAARLEALAHEDALTGVLNRRGFMRDLTRAVAFGSRYGVRAALLLVDLDRFKPVNDRYGHPIGDRALKHVADLLRRYVRSSDSVGRLGGDEFVLVIWQVDESAAVEKARAIEKMIAASPFNMGRTVVQIGASIGATLLKAEDTAEEVLARDDHAITCASGSECRLSDDIGGELVLQKANAVLEDELALFQALNLQLVAGDHALQRFDGPVEITVLLLEPGEFQLELGCFLLRQIRTHCQSVARRSQSGPRTGRSMRERIRQSKFKKS